ncbi:YLR271W [Zygosaccharomyces parabailii]|uniref:ZYBA0S05-02278g1_1 n=1 Tax=Zygosaccharomyces bailii (strain CLIB 213 / ATCC 58445 / CBS 680 / BCRC 21525 / NBRC 1098 / NCYC 1416 / NRRL Y-2227) TaxID=1333698 RepID=A0A8J2T851_ZYGB2|nr:YLR271W [Zygosaccharomyces parabailii]CDF89812.1 ZYBA0S05-02278g1_1 [Zygosaccharomyces bailii CLIB 213]CDH17568.1 uncharacterized protein ZBAI_09356 [Zygosaccharomyces bailii ISA1307]
MAGSEEKRQGPTYQEPLRKRQKISKNSIHHEEQKVEEEDNNVKLQTAQMKHLMPKGYQMMTRMGYRTGDILGSQGKNGYNTTRLSAPIEPRARDSTAAFDTKKDHSSSKAAEEEWRQWFGSREEEKRKFNLWRRMQKTAFEMTGDADVCLSGSDPRDFNVLWRPYVRELIEVNRKEPIVEEPETDEEFPIQREYDQNGTVELNDTSSAEPQSSHIEIESVSGESDDGDDEELKALYEMNIGERLMKLHIFLRYELYYCYFCGVKYKDEQDLHAHCPGLTESEHE